MEEVSEDDLIKLIRVSYASTNREYLQSQIDIASAYLTEDQKAELAWEEENGYRSN